MTEEAISKLAEYAMRTGLAQEEEYAWVINTIIDTLKLDTYSAPRRKWDDIDIVEVLAELSRDAYERGVIPDDSFSERERFECELMGRLTPRPSQVISKFNELYAESPAAATDWYYEFSCNTNYIHRDRCAKDIRWKVPSEYGEIDITINLSKPEKDPRDIAKARNMSASDYPMCALCAENEGYSGRPGHAPRANHRIIPMDFGGSRWYLQYSPYVYYNEHCICLNSEHIPMKIDRGTFERILTFVERFPHYFIGSNADLPIVGGSILSHDHFQGGRYTFAEEKAPIETKIVFPGYEDIEAGIVKWPMSVIRIAGGDKERLCELADKILRAWRGYSDETATVFAETDGVEHNTITPIGRMRGGKLELDLVLRNNLTTGEHPLGVFHPHSELHHIKKENIGLIEVMGLAVLPARLKAELDAVAKALISGEDMTKNELTASHAEWAEDIKKRCTADSGSVSDILRLETGKVFVKVLEHAGVFKRTPDGAAAFMRFIKTVR